MQLVCQVRYLYTKEQIYKLTNVTDNKLPNYVLLTLAVRMIHILLEVDSMFATNEPLFYETNHLLKAMREKKASHRVTE